MLLQLKLLGLTLNDLIGLVHPTQFLFVIPQLHHSYRLLLQHRNFYFLLGFLDLNQENPNHYQLHIVSHQADLQLICFNFLSNISFDIVRSPTLYWGTPCFIFKLLVSLSLLTPEDDLNKDQNVASTSLFYLWPFNLKP